VDAAGIVSSNGRYLFRERGQGIVRTVFTKEMLDRLQGMAAIGHIRYATSGEEGDGAKYDNVQPILGTFNGMPIAIAHNGNLTNIEELGRHVAPSERTTSMDTEFILRLLEREKSQDIEHALANVLALLKGSYELLILMPDRLIAVRDPHGNHPLSIGRSGDSYFVSSETCAYPSIQAEYVGDVEAGTFVTIKEHGQPVASRYAEASLKQCAFELVYYAHPGSFVFGSNVGRFRQNLGIRLEAEFGIPGSDIVIGVPDSSNFIAMGFGKSGRSGEYYPAISRHHNVGRTFIAATQAMRDEEVASKFTFSTHEVAGKTVVLIDDSIVRGTTLRKVIGVMRQMGAKAVHVRIGSAPFRHPCRYGINTKSYDELIANQKTVEGICEEIGADSLAYLSIKSLQDLTGRPGDYCFACMNGKFW
ncbi:MAG TPA: amidophosphoribosyltransferase, partial [Candidatus Paceibacterota bacterium]|nr:amidophosphoribosyltransferase [Candidatus Paceibacterota bacterium]